MDKIVEAILKLQPFGRFFKWLGCNDDWSALFSVLLITLIVTLIVAVFVKTSNVLFKRYKHKKEALEDIKPQFDHLSIKKAKQFYIQTQYQNASPSRQEEPGFTHKYIARAKLIPFFNKIAFNEKVDSERFYLILADSGMGKTTFMVNLYLAYNSFFSFSRKYKMKLFRFSNPDTINQVKSIITEDAKKTILLLDALDEDRGIISTDPAISDATAFQKRINEIIEITQNFREVVITCRTQYFPGQEDDPYELEIKRPDEKGFCILNKLYISPFNEEEVKKYLNKKFGIIPFINQKKKKQALEIVSKSKNLVMRPMLLSYIDYLIEGEFTKITTCSIYDKLVSKWLEREAYKRKGLADIGSFMESLRNLSFKTAIAIYTNWREEGRMYLTKEEALRIAEQFSIQLKAEEITGQSLLTCDGVGNWKFAHKSILEFFLAHEAFQSPRFLHAMNFKGMDMAKKIYEELNPRLIFVDQSTGMTAGLSDEIKRLPDHYIYKSPVSHDEFVEILGPDKDFFRNWNVNQDFTFREAIAFCNKLNFKHGYAPVYDDGFHLLDVNGNRIKSIDRVRGFRLPTQMEFQTFITEEPYRNYFSTDEISKAVVYNKPAMKLKLEVAGFEIKSIKSTLITKEWCYDGRAVSVFGLKNSLSELSSFNASDIIENCFETLSAQHVFTRYYALRLVFVP
jgi:hypothetical protein